MIRRAEEILANVTWLISQLDDDALEEVQDLPFLEMAKCVSIKNKESDCRQENRRQRVPLSMHRRPSHQKPTGVWGAAYTEIAGGKKCSCRFTIFSSSSL